MFNYFGVRLNGGKKLTLNLDYTDLGKQYALLVENATLNVNDGKADGADATITLTKPALDAVQLGEKTLDQAIADGDIKVDARTEALGEFRRCSTPSRSGSTSSRHKTGMAKRTAGPLRHSSACEDADYFGLMRKEGVSDVARAAQPQS